jgi:hypothetical protein
MTFTSQITRQASERTILARITPKRDVTLQLSLVAGTEYQVAIPYNVMSVTLNGVALTRLTAAPTVLNSFFYNNATGVLFVNSATAPNVTTGVFIAFYRIYLTSGAGSALPDDPTVLTANQVLRQWEPRIGSDPSFSQGFDDITQGVFQISQLNLIAGNADNFFNKYFTKEDSFYNAKADVWAFIDSIANIKRLYTGSVAKVTIGETVSITINDTFNQLKRIANMRSRIAAPYLDNTGFYGSIDPTKVGRILPFICGAKSRAGNSVIDFTSVGIALDFDTFYLDRDDCNEAVCTANFNPIPLVTRNRSWSLCRVPNNGSGPGTSVLKQNSFTSLTRAVGGGATFGFIIAQVNGPNANYDVGDTFRWIEAGTPYFATVITRVPFVSGGLNYNLAAFAPSSVAGGSYISAASTSVTSPAIAVQIEFGNGPLDRYFVREGLDYTVLETSENLDGSFVGPTALQRRISITLVNNFEANVNIFGPATGIVPSQLRMFYRVTPAYPYNHADLLKRMVEFSGMTADAASFAAAALALPVNVAMQMPAPSESSLGSYLSYAQKILGSTFGYLNVNDAGAVEYKLLGAPAAGSQVNENNAVFDDIDVDYQDIATGIVAQNPDIKATVIQLDDPAVRNLHEIENTITFDHVLQDISSRITAIFTILKRRKAIYKATLSHNFLTMLLGQDISLIGTDILGYGDPSGSYDNGVNLKTQNVSVTMDSVRIEATDLAAF